MAKTTKPADQVTDEQKAKKEAEAKAKKATEDKAKKEAEAKAKKATEDKAKKEADAKAKKKAADAKKPDFRTKRAQEVFASHKVDEVFFTSDDTCFTNSQFAGWHAATLKDDKVDTVTKKDLK